MRRQPPASLRQLLPVAFLVVAVLAVQLGVALGGAAQAQKGERILGGLDPAFQAGADRGAISIQWLYWNSGVVGWAVSGVSALIALTGLAVHRRRALPLLAMAVAASLLTWAQITVFADQAAYGYALYGCGILAAAVLGMWVPLTRLEEFSLRRPLSRLELIGVFVLSAAAIVTRMYALNELPASFDGEMTVSMLASRTVAGLLHYLPWGMPANSTGVLHLLLQMTVFQFLGASIYTLRLTATLWGVTSVLLFYGLMRRLAGVVPAIGATVLFLTAPEQLFWSRTENTHFAPVAFVGLVAAHLGLSVVRRFSAGSLIAAALWMPVCRFVYSAGIVMFAQLVLACALGLVFVRGAWRKAWYAVPITLGGVALWLISFSVVHSYVSDAPWRLVDPTVSTYVRSIVQKQGELAAVEESQASLVMDNLRGVIRAITDRSGFSHWYQRADPTPHPTMINVGRTILLAFGLGYLLGQLNDPRAWLLLGWLAIGLVPGIVSIQAADRRMALIFPAIDVIAGIGLAATVRVVRACADKVLAAITAALLGLVVAAIAWTNLASHFLLPIGPIAVERQFRFARPIFQESDAIFHNFGPSSALLLVFGNVEHFLRPGSTPGFQFVPPGDWLKKALDPSCDFNDPVYGFTLSPERIESLRTAYRPQRITFLMEVREPDSQRHFKLLQLLYPSGRLRTYAGQPDQADLAALTVSAADVEALHRPVLLSGAAPAGVHAVRSKLLSGVTLKADTAGAAAPAGTLVVRGGVLLDQDGWYRFGVSGDCRQAEVEVDGQETLPDGSLRPMLAGVHDLRLTLTEPDACALPLTLEMQSQGDAAPQPVPASRMLAPELSLLGEVKPLPLAVYQGYDAPSPYGSLPGGIIDFGLDASGRLTALVAESGAYRVRRYRADGAEEASWEIQPVPTGPFYTISVAPDATTVVRAHGRFLVFDPTGREIASGDDRVLGGERDITFLADGRLLAPLSFENALAVVGRDGSQQGKWTKFDGGPGSFNQPVAVLRVAEDRLVVVEGDGQVLVLRLTETGLEFERAFRIDFSGPVLTARGYGFDGSDRLLIPDVAAPATLAYRLDGARLLAADAARDLNRMGWVKRMLGGPDRLYVLDGFARLWTMGRASEHAER